MWGTVLCASVHLRPDIHIACEDAVYVRQSSDVLACCLQELIAQRPALPPTAVPTTAAPTPDLSLPNAQAPTTSVDPGSMPASSQTPGGVQAVASTSQQAVPAAVRPSTAPAPALAKPKPPAGVRGGVKGKLSAEAPTFALGWFADSGEDCGEERLWLEEQMLVADGVKDKVRLPPPPQPSPPPQPLLGARAPLVYPGPPNNPRLPV